ncbi:hypothetical protein BLOT_003387 [Blomia tropicalis]|nr:hypothetical protein BLOT_003387 [Blomia tropicalis]
MKWNKKGTYPKDFSFKSLDTNYSLDDKLLLNGPNYVFNQQATNQSGKMRYECELSGWEKTQIICN